MSMFWTLAGLVAVPLAGAIVYAALHLRKIGLPTTGPVIERAARPNTALVVIDVQEDYTRNTGKHAYDPQLRDAALACIQRDIADARTAGHEVIFVKNIFRAWPAVLAMKLAADGLGTEGRPGLDIDGTLDICDAPVFEKEFGDAFSASDFTACLESRKIGHLTLVGLDACHCVQLTAKGALMRGYDVTIKEPAVLTSTPTRWPSLKDELTNLGAEFA